MMFDFMLCELCDNYTETVTCKCGEIQCELCFNAYGCDCTEEEEG